MKLPEELKTPWIKALRSGEYQQGTGRLMTNENGVKKYCCIGVFGAVHNLLDEEVNGQIMNFKERDLHTWYLPLSRYIGPEEVNNLVNMNDGRIKSFSQIADYIEQNL